MIGIMGMVDKEKCVRLALWLDGTCAKLLLPAPGRPQSMTNLGGFVEDAVARAAVQPLEAFGFDRGLGIWSQSGVSSDACESGGAWL